ncbi:DUF2993 domain-containing protein [Streptomyces sp. NPDC050619]|uniref:LmeA family phospholipid-binding protein n=1 Tax=Streptomyces sp. NPDC050619 TaxID=3157214 RepID=UPI0034415F2C
MRTDVIAVAALLTLAFLTVSADRLATAWAEARTAKAIQDGMETPAPPAVHVRGFPVLPQLAVGTLRHVDVTAHDIPARGTDRPLPVSELTLRLDDLRKSDDDSAAHARSAEAVAHLSYADVSNALGLEISQGTRPGQVSAAVLLPLGNEVTVTTSVSAAFGNRVAFKDFHVTGDRLPAVGEDLLDKAFEEPIQLRNIPAGLHLRTITTTATGLSARFSGRSVTFHPDPAGEADPAQTSATGTAP